VAAYVEQLGTAAEDRGAAVAGGIGRVQSAADFDDDVVAEGNVSAQSIGKMIFPAVAGPQDVKPTLPAPPKTPWTKTCQRKTVWSTNRA